MGLLEKEIQELRTLNRRLEEGTIKNEDVHAKIAIYSQVEKREKMLLQAMKMTIDHGGGKAAYENISDSNLIGGSICLEDSPAEQKIACPLKEMSEITRSDCLDISGDAENYEFCKDCKHFGVTRSMIMGQKNT